MADSGGMAIGAPVRLNGILVGNVEQIRLSGSKDQARVVEFVMEVDKQYQSQIPVDSVAGLAGAVEPHPAIRISVRARHRRP